MKKNKKILLLCLLPIFVLSRCTKVKNFIFSVSEIEKIQFYDQKLDGNLVTFQEFELEETKIEDFITELKSINYYSFRSEIKALSEYYFTITLKNKYFYKFEAYRVNKFDSSSNNVQHYKYSCDYSLVFMPFIERYHVVQI